MIAKTLDPVLSNLILMTIAVVIACLVHFLYSDNDNPPTIDGDE